ncbi:plasminogen activator inhibitor 1 RNA-binding protein-like isoform X2 [Gambusia affinis]|uniref:plasminogen activator inhibitor 1 RNA-binding protein-like isoform X2 n=1 Tax=Gambusia affinis TaxID=33528 RepID=UPI001CDC72F9|nr:plasminogen activator inhibitor 1 RNA-binding protein-like isoform X2 [Gambusia affinis]
MDFVTIVNKHTASAACSEWRALLGVPDDARTGREGGSSQPSCGSIQRFGRIKPRRIGGESRRRGAIMPGHLQEGFGCVVTNRFDQLLDDESDPFEVLKAAENKKKEGAASGSTKTAAQAAKQPKKESQKDRKNPLLDKKEESQAPVPLKKEGIRRVGRKPDQQGQSGSQHQGGQGEGRPADKRPDRRPPRERRFEKPAEDKPEGGADFPVDKPSGDRPPRGRGGGRGGRGGRGRGMGRGEGFDSRGKREFDRHSANDKSSKTEEKRGGSGSYNWGTVKDDMSEAEQTAAPEPTPEGEENAPAGSENKENEVEEVKQEGPKEMTLDEWKAMQDKERTKVEFNIRKPNEGADSQWKKGYVLHKSKSEDRPVGALIDVSETEAEPQALFNKGAADESSDHHFRKPANDITSQLEINFGDLGRPGRGRGGARGGRGSRGGGGSRTARGGGRSEKASGVSVPNVDDPEAFPALA